MSDTPFIGEVIMFAGNFAPRGWSMCDGKLLPISQFSALFSLLGTTYGGDGRTTFALPDLRGRFPMAPGNGPGLSPRSQGQKGGTERVTLTEAQIPPHSHAMNGTTSAVNTGSPTGTALAQGTDVYTNMGSPNTALHPNSISKAGGGQPHENMPPYLAINFIIALQGTYPSRS